MDYSVLDIIGTIAFVASGAVVAMEAEYDIWGFYTLSLVTAFGGGVIRNILIGIPVSSLWDQQLLINVSLITITILTILPKGWVKIWNKWGHFFDAIGLSAFAIQGAIYASQLGHPITAIVVSSVMTGIGGGIIRDMLACRKPLVLRDEIYAVWAMLAGVVVGLHYVSSSVGWYTLFVFIVGLRMLSVFYKWRLPRRSLSK
ncbi:MAG TPA: trimeric intracellular cation channel family protein [Bacillota bacterium]|nr:trimeric intracellular cation channel family protein [Bacillota bacterium]